MFLAFPIFLIFAFILQFRDSLTIAEKLKNTIFVGYDNTIRPVINEKDTLIVNITINSLSVLVLDPSEETVSFSAEFILQWRDEFLKWNRSDYNVTWIKIKQQFVWTPDTTVSTSIDTVALLDSSDRYVSLKYDGTVRQSLYAVFKNLCDMNVNKFPYDKQSCAINIGPWSYTIEEIQCVAGQDIPEAVEDYFTGNSEWDFERINASLTQTNDPDVNFTYSEVEFMLIVKRRPQFYVWVLLIPTYIITVVCIFGLFTPTSNDGIRGERVNLGITTLLSSAVILQIVASSMPKTSELPLLGNFILAEIFVVAIGVLCTVLIISIHHRAHTREWRPPRWLLAILRMTGSRKFFVKTSRIFSERRSSEGEVLEFRGESGNLMQNLDSALAGIQEFIRDDEQDEVYELTWMKFFDRIDFIFLIVFQIANALVTIFIVKP